ncbi:iron-containing alcohol dehydrogenase [Microbacterium sp. SLBN-146]|uniref:iron-containing alcohol dehydrogenase n=1 Tax=Microbacterium sp. SLBN-146 TaxID=2768457 RepID=UPI00114E85DA|nr:iron-containing alcohol dehydrogenase [Microbacterium sp. SLBN-146]TQJ30474.1 alcohol dehydrogenase class IV [Microbacterium sp. SLBN-146]
MMSATVIHAAVGHTAETLRTLCHARRTAVVFDHGVPGATERVREVSPSLALPLGSDRDARGIGLLAERLRRHAPAVIVAVGGGTTIDAVKLAALACRDEALFAYALRSADQRALTLLPRAMSPAPQVIAVPTTTGTSSEVNSVAVVDTRGGRRLVVGDQLRPAHAVIDGEALLSLPEAAVREGCLEALLRVAGRATGTRVASAVAIDLATALARAGDDDLGGADTRLRAAQLGAATQSPALGIPAAFSMKHWYLANEVSFVLQTRKIPATAAVLPAVWGRIESGDDRWGRSEGLRSLWRPVADAIGLPHGPVDGIHALLHRWRIPIAPAPTSADITRIAEATENAWGLGRPPLRGIDRAEISRVLQDAVWASRGPIGSRREEVMTI